MTAPTRTPEGATAVWGRRGLHRFLATYLPANIALFGLYMGIAGVLLPVQVEAFDPANKELNLAVVTGVSAVFAMLFNPIGGALSDRTRTRWGRRNPWMLGSAAAVLLLLLTLGFAPAVWALLVGWCAVQAMANVYQAALTATVPDRVPENRRGTASAALGIADAVGIVVGTALAAVFVARVEVGYLIFGVAIVGAAVLFASLTHDPRGAELPPRPETTGRGALLEQLRGFGTALRSPDFTWAFTGRALMMLGFFVIMGYQYYILSDFIVLPDGMTPAGAVTILALIYAVCTVACTAVIGPYSDRINRRKIFAVLGGVIAAATMLLPVLLPTLVGIAIWAAIAGGAFGIFMAVDHAIVTLVLPKQEDAARDLGVLNIANAGPQIIAPFFAGVTVVVFGSYAFLFLLGAIFALLGGLAITRVKAVM